MKQAYIALLVGITSGIFCGFLINSWNSDHVLPTVRASAGSCQPVTEEIQRGLADSVNRALALEQTKRLATIENKIVDACIAKHGIPVQDLQNGNMVDCKFTTGDGK